MEEGCKINNIKETLMKIINRITRLFKESVST